MDDIPPIHCDPEDAPVVAPDLGTWEPEITASGFLVVRVSLNLLCGETQAWNARYAVTFGPDDDSANFEDVDSDSTYMAKKMPTEACTPDFSLCDTPSLVW